jgi:DNA-binding HxlR family transcriptional regulator
VRRPSLRQRPRARFVSRRVYLTIPPRVDYSLTPLGRSFLEPLDTLIRWADDHHATIRKARESYAPPSFSS